MKRVTITKFFLAIIVALAIIAGAVLAFIFINPNVLGLITSDGRVTISQADYDQLIELNDKYSKAEYIRKRLESDYYIDIDEQDLEDGMIKGLVSGLGDIYSGYYTKSEYDNLLVSLTGEYDGVGITMIESESGYIEVFGITKNSPAEKGGVQIGEYIYKVDGKAYTAKSMDLAAAAVRGKAGTQVEITFISNGSEIVRTFTRAHITSDTVECKILADNIGYIQISSFENATAKDFKDSLSQISTADALIIDLRDNPGGLVESAVEIADMLMDKATIVYTENRQGDREYLTTKDGKIWNKPFAVLVNENSASAAEIFAAGIKENKVAPIIGTTTFGKGIIQQLEPLSDGSALKLTMWQYFTPSGIAIHQAGVVPQYISNDPNAQLEKAMDLLIKK